MSINYQINNLFHTLQFYNNQKLNINYIKSESLYDLSIDQLENYIFIDHNTTAQKSISYGLTLINNIMSVANNIQMIQNMYSNKVIFIHNDLVNYLKKEDQFILFNSVKDYKIYSFVPNANPNIEHIQYGFEKNAKKYNQDRGIDVLLLYQQQNKNQTEILFRALKAAKYNNVEIVCSNHLTSYSMAIDLLNNAKVCIDTVSYYNLLLSVSCGCSAIGFNTTYDLDFILSQNSIEAIPKVVNSVLEKYNDQYIDSTQKYIDQKYNYTNYINNIETIINNNLNLEVSL